MSTKRQPSKQRRQTQNQKQRAALEARRAAAAVGKAPAGKVGGTSSSSSGRSVLSRLRGGGGSSSSSSGSSAPTSGGSALSRLRGATTTGRAARTARTGGTGSTPVGHRAALSALFAAIVGAVVGAVLFKVPVDRAGDAIVTREALVAEWVLSAEEAAQDEPDATAERVADSVEDWTPGGSQPYVQAFWPISLAVVLPVLGTGIGFRAVSRRSPAKVVNRTMYVTLFGALLTSQLLLVFLPAVISLAVAAFQVRKAEMAAMRAAAPDEVIEVDEVSGTEDGSVGDDEPSGDQTTERDDRPR